MESRDEAPLPIFMLCGLISPTNTASFEVAAALHHDHLVCALSRFAALAECSRKGRPSRLPDQTARLNHDFVSRDIWRSSCEAAMAGACYSEIGSAFQRVAVPVVTAVMQTTLVKHAVVTKSFHPRGRCMKFPRVSHSQPHDPPTASLVVVR